MTAAVVAAGRGYGVLAGVCLAVACLTKQTAVTTALPVAYLLFRRDGWTAVARAPAPLPPSWWSSPSSSGLEDFLLWTVTGNGGYLALRGSLLGTAVRGVGMTGAFLVFNGIVVWCAVVAHRRGANTVDLWLWLGGAAVAVLAGFRFFGHYYLQLLPPLVLMAAAGLPATRRAWRWAAAGVLVPVVPCGRSPSSRPPTGASPPTPRSPPASPRSPRPTSDLRLGPVPRAVLGGQP